MNQLLILYQGQYPECFGRPMPEVNGLNQKKSSRIPGSIQLFPLQVIQSSSLFLSAYSIMYLFIALLNPKAVTALNPLKRCKIACPIIPHYMGMMISQEKTKKKMKCPKKKVKNLQKRNQVLKIKQKHDVDRNLVLQIVF